MRYGVVFPQTEIGSDPMAVREFAQAVEELGFEYLLAYDHVLGANPDRPAWQDGQRRPYSHESMFHEIFVLFGYLAAITKSIELVTGILIAPQRQTALIAKQAAEVDVLSGGRLRLGMGIGWNEVEYEGLGQDFHKRGQRLEEQVEVLRALWTERLVTASTGNEQIQDAGIYPLPMQRPIPIWMGGSADLVLRRMAKMADGWIMPTFDIRKSTDMLETIGQYLAEENRDRSSFGIEQRIILQRVPQMQWADWVKEREALGIDEIGVYPVGNSPDMLINSLYMFKERVGF